MFEVCKRLQPDYVSMGDLVALPIYNLYRLVPTIYAYIQFPSMNSFSRILFMNSLSQLFFYKFDIMNSFSRITLQIHKYSKHLHEFARHHFGSFL